MSQQNWVAVCHLNDIVPYTGVCAEVGAHQVAVFRFGQNDVYAISNYDPFGKANVLSRGLVGDIKGNKVVASPLYKQHFCLDSGRCLEDDFMRVPTYQVRLTDDQMIEVLNP